MARHRHLTKTTQFSRTWIESDLFPLSDKLRNDEPPLALMGRAVYCLFYEPSFVTRTSFERAVGLLGGQSYHTEDASQFFPIRTPGYVDNIINMLASLRIDLVVLRSSDIGVVERAELSDAMPVVNGGSINDHPTQALTDLYTLRRELGEVDGAKLAIVGRLEHRNVSALLKGLALFNKVSVTLIPFSGHIDSEVAEYCEERGMDIVISRDIEVVKNVDAVYLNGPRTVAHVQLLKSRDSFNLRIDSHFMSMLKPHCIILDPMQRSGDFAVEVQDDRLAFYRQAENALFVRMAVLHHMLAGQNVS